MTARNIGIDLGYGFVKTTDGDKDYVFSSVVGAGQDLTYRSELTTYVDPIQNLAVTIDGKKYFVGDLAIRQSEILSRSLGESHVQEKNTKVLLLTALALYVHGENEEFNVVTGLPPSFYLANKDALTEIVKGSHTILLNTDGTDKKKVININNVKIIPQPMGTMFQKLFDNKGTVEDKEMARSRIGIIDVGFRTTDFAVVDKLEYIDKLSYSTTTGMSNAYAAIAEHLRNQYRVFKENYDLDEIIQKAQIKIAGKVISLEQVKKDIYEQVAGKILTEMNSIWDRKDLDVIFLSGGGGQALSEFLLPELETATLVDNSQSANVHGYLKLGQKVFGFTENKTKPTENTANFGANRAESRFTQSSFFEEDKSKEKKAQ